MIAVSEISNGGARDDAASSLHERHHHRPGQEILSYEISDEALEGAARTKQAANYTLFYCTALDLCPGP